MSYKLKKRIQYDKHVLNTMIRLYCRAKHNPLAGKLCDECEELRDYCFGKAEKCTLGLSKTTCQKCPRHCYSKDYKERIRTVMRYSGPRLIFAHPIMAIKHILK